ncbi:MAG: hypothetical protein AABW89_05715 [Nanoarchaeota archaeon]
MKKISGIIVIGIVASILVLSIFVSAQSTGTSTLSKIWQVISEIKQDISKIKISILDLEQKVDNIHLESRIAIFNITITSQAQYGGVNVSCNSNEFATGGGIRNDESNANAYLVDFYPINQRTWHVGVSGNLDYGTIRLVCVKY